MSCMPPLRAESFKAAAELSAVGLPSSRCGEVCDKRNDQSLNELAQTEYCKTILSRYVGLGDVIRLSLHLALQPGRSLNPH